ncbi:MAG TPA: hypothetical protein VEB68_03720 [Croceibacterium sp.]|nr:hypothetical protein [Croceibacterium sp.]
MNFDQMLETWKAQDEAPLYGVNSDLLQLVLEHERADIRRQLRREQWATYGLGMGMAAFAGFWLWVAILRAAPVLTTVAAGAGTAAFALGMAALWLSLRRQRRRERQFGNTLREEIARNLSLLDYQLSRFGRWSAAMLWTAPMMVGCGLVYWLMIEVNHDPGESRWDHAWIVIVLVWMGVFLPYAGSRDVQKKLEPRRQRLAELLETLNAGE